MITKILEIITNTGKAEKDIENLSSEVETLNTGLEKTNTEVGGLKKGGKAFDTLKKGAKGVAGGFKMMGTALKAAGMKAKKCRAMRTDGAFVEAGEQDNLIVQKLNEDTTAYGIFGFSYLDQNTDKIATGRKVLLSKYDVSEDIKSIEVYASYFFKLF